jgi:hypothetical protein
MSRATASGISVTAAGAVLVKGMLNRGDRLHDIAAWFRRERGRIAKIATGDRLAHVTPRQELLPPPGPYMPGRLAHATVAGFEQVRDIFRASDPRLRKSPSANSKPRNELCPITEVTGKRGRDGRKAVLFT